MARPLDLVAEVKRFAWAALRQFEGVAQDPVNAAAGKDRLLNHHFMLGAFIGAAAEGGIFAFGIFAHHVKNRYLPAFLPASGQGTPGNRRTGRRLTY